MALTAHQQLHLDAVVAECIANRAESQSVKDKLADAKGIVPAAYNGYLNSVEAQANGILSSEVFPPGLARTYTLHDHLEKS